MLPRNPFLHGKSSRGLTLIEVMVALGILVILVSGIFMLVQTSLKTVLLIDRRASREDEITNLVDILRSNFRNLPHHAYLKAELLKHGGEQEYLLLMGNASGFMTWLASRGSDNEVVLLSLRQSAESARWRVRMKRFDPPVSMLEQQMTAPAALKAASDVPWLELVGDLERVGVRFYDGSNDRWMDDWKKGHSRPALIEWTMIYEHTKDSRSAAAVFWLPPVRGGMR